MTHAGWLTKQQVLAMLRKEKIHNKTFWKKFGCQTCPVFPDGSMGFYHSDIEQCIVWCKEKREPKPWEWD
jgi:hypothetical protein